MALVTDESVTDVRVTDDRVTDGPVTDDPVAAESVVDDSAPTTHRNEVHLRGRVSMGAARRELPSGTSVVGIRIVVERDPRTLRGRATRIDAIDCVAWDPDNQQTIGEWSPGDVVEIVGSLRRRFRRTESGPMSRYEVEIEVARLIGPAGVEQSDNGPEPAASEAPGPHGSNVEGAESKQSA
jgi:single-strand DNA-binding protein